MNLETERIKLRDFHKADWTAVHQYASNPEVFRYMKGHPNTKDQSQAYVERIIAHQHEQPRQDYEFAIVLKTNDHLIGAIRITITNSENKQGSIGYILNPEYWNQGYITEACHEIINFGFDKLELHRISAICAPENMASIRVLQKIGMRLEGHLREEAISQGKWRDSLVYALLEQEWRTQNANKLAPEQTGNQSRPAPPAKVSRITKAPRTTQDNSGVNILHLLSEFELNRKIASEYSGNKLMPLHTEVWDANQQKLDGLHANLRDELDRIYTDIGLLNHLVWFSSELHSSSPELHQQYTKLLSNIARRLEEIVRVPLSRFTTQ